MSAVQEAVKTALDTPIKLDIGCGKNKQPGFLGVDIIDFEGVDMVADLRERTWWFKKYPDELAPRLSVSMTTCSLPDNSVDQVHCAHFIEHLTNFGDKWERVNFFNELYRVLKPGAQATLIFPHWCSNRFYGDPTHKEPISEMAMYYLRREWRLGGTKDVPNGNAPHTDISYNHNGYSCDFDAGWGYNLHQGMANRHPDYVHHAMSFWKEACTDMICTLIKPAAPR